MYSSQIEWVKLFEALHNHQGEDVYCDLLEAWLENHQEECLWIADFQRRTQHNWKAATDEDLCLLYAISRVTSTLLLRFQIGRADGTDYSGPAIHKEGFQIFHEQLGFRVLDVVAFHPFYHEVLSVTPTSDPHTLISIDECKWPILMLGDMIYCRSGCSVTAGLSYIDKRIAESSKLYWTYRRKDRPCNDPSYGWGHNSQWRTQFRRDYLSNNKYQYNVDGKTLLNDCQGMIDGIPVTAMIELVRHRCFVNSQVNDEDLYPYLYQFVEIRTTGESS